MNFLAPVILYQKFAGVWQKIII